MFQSKRLRELTSNYNSDDLKSLHVLRSEPQDASLTGCPWFPEVFGGRFRFSTACTFIFEIAVCSFLRLWQWNWTWLSHEGDDKERKNPCYKVHLPLHVIFASYIQYATGSIDFLPGGSTCLFYLNWCDYSCGRITVEQWCVIMCHRGTKVFMFSLWTNISAAYLEQSLVLDAKYPKTLMQKMIDADFVYMHGQFLTAHL